MKQAIIKKGNVYAEDISPPNVSEYGVLIKVVNSCISAGTEMSGVVNSGKPLIKRAMEQPANVLKVFDMAKTVGIQKTIAKVKGTLDAGNTTGYSISGVVIAAGSKIKNLKVGDRVAAAGAGLAHHAEYVDVPENLVMKLPDDLSFEYASTVTLGGIAMQGVRRADAKLGEYVFVVGAGILGLLTVQMLKSSGARVAVSDIDNSRLELAKAMGAELVFNPINTNPVNEINNWTGGYGCDSVIFTAATSSNEPLSQSFQACKRKGKVILVGVSGMEIKREDIYKKEIDFQISTSYGPGRYDSEYEEKGNDYPYAYVRWTENRNMTEYLRLISSGSITLDSLINGVYPIEKVTEAYQSLKSTETKPLMVLLDYGQFEENIINGFSAISKKVEIKQLNKKSGTINYALVGAGGFATGMHMPNLETMNKDFNLVAVMNRTGHKAKAVATQYGAKYATTDYSDILKDDSIDTVLIATRHDSHAELTLQALKAGKNVFLEKPLATTPEQLQQIKMFFEEAQSPPMLMVGFNRRFSQYIQEIDKHTSKRINPLFISYRMNAGHIPLDSWIHQDGGRIIGEACHLIDTMNFLTKSEIVSISTESLSPSNEKFVHNDNRSIILKYKDGSVCHINYFAVGSKSLAKENMEVHFDGKSIIMDDYKSLKGYGCKINEMTSVISQKGQYEEMVAFKEGIKTGKAPISLNDIFQTTEATFLIEY